VPPDKQQGIELSSLEHLLSQLERPGESEMGINYETMLLDFLDAETERLTAANNRYFQSATWVLQADYVKKELRKSLGLDPLPNRTPLDAQVVGSIDRDGYIIEKVLFDARPGFTVPAHMYIPSPLRKGQQIPAILYSCGHWMENGKMEPDIQACCIGLAKAGFAVLVYDPIGQGERGCSFETHGHRDFLLLGMSQAGLMVWESMRAVDYLLTRPEVDGNRIGMTGASGGGLNTLYTCAVDERIAVSVPVCYVTSFVRFLRAMRGQNWNGGIDLCNQVPNLIRYGGMAAAVSCIFPRAVMCINATFDPQFPIEGVREVVEKAKRAYGVLGESRVKLVEINSDHGYNQMMREAAYGWFGHWFLDHPTDTPIKEPSFKTEDPRNPVFRCLQEPRSAQEENQLLSDVARSVHAGLRTRREEPAGTTDKQSLLLKLKSELDATFETSSGIGEAYVIAHRSITTTQGHEGTRYVLKTEPGIYVPVIEIGAPTTEVKSQKQERARVYLSDEGKNSYLKTATLEPNALIYSFDVRGTGETVVPAPKIQWLATVEGTLERIQSKPGDTLEIEVATNSLILGRSLLSQQIYDARVVLKWIRSRLEENGPFEVISSGPRSSLIALIVSCLEESIEKLVMERTLVALDSVIGLRISCLPMGCHHFGLLKSFDVSQLLALSNAKDIVLSRCIDAHGKPLAADLAIKELKWARQFLGAETFDEMVTVQ
jgi:hypothetical protein